MIDAFLHPLRVPDVARLGLLHREPLSDLVRGVQDRLARLGAGGGHVVWMDDHLLDEPWLTAWAEAVRDPQIWLLHSCLIDPRTQTAAERLRRARKAGFCGLLFHPIHQHLARSDFDACVDLAGEAEALGMFITVGCAYGTRDQERFQGVPLAIELSRHVRVPIIMGHGGGAKVLDAFLAAADSDQLFLDLSFSLPYWLGSSVELDFAFAMHRSPDRWLWGSDAPFVEMERAKRVIHAFFDRHAFVEAERLAVLNNNAERLWEAWR